jgi:hypothetical protein
MKRNGSGRKEAAGTLHVVPAAVPFPRRGHEPRRRKSTSSAAAVNPASALPATAASAMVPMPPRPRPSWRLGEPRISALQGPVAFLIPLKPDQYGHARCSPVTPAVGQGHGLRPLVVAGDRAHRLPASSRHPPHPGPGARAGAWRFTRLGGQPLNGLARPLAPHICLPRVKPTSFATLDYTFVDMPGGGCYVP